MEGMKKREPLFLVVPSHRTSSNRRTVKHKEFHLNIRKKKFLVRVIKLWNRLPREVAESPNLQTFKLQLEMIQDILILLTLL